MQRAYAAVGTNFTGKDDLIGAEYSKLLKLEMVPERWPLARLSFSLQTCVDHLDRVLAGCCWEVQASRTTPSASLASLHEVAKCLQYCAFTLLQLLDTADLRGTTALIVPTQCYQGM